MLSTIFLCVATIVTGAAIGKPTGWVVLALGVLALLAGVGVHFWH